MAILTPRPVAKHGQYYCWDRCALNWTQLGRRLKLSPQQAIIVKLIVTEDLRRKRSACVWASRRLRSAPNSTHLRTKLGVHSRAAIVATAWRAWMGMEGENRA